MILCEKNSDTRQGLYQIVQLNFSFLILVLFVWLDIWNVHKIMSIKFNFGVLLVNSQSAWNSCDMKSIYPNQLITQNMAIQYVSLRSGSFIEIFFLFI